MDAKNISKIFLVEADGVNLKNLTFINGKSRNESDNGPYQGTVNWQGSNGTIVNCSFINNSGDEKSYGASILWKGSYGKISDSIFKNSYSGANGGAIFALGENLTINNSEFINNHGKEGGAIYFGGSSAMWIINSIFINNSADSGGALAACAMNRQVINSKFIGNSANNGGSISWCGSNGLISNSTFINNSADQKGGSILFTGTNNLVKGSVFINSSANIGGAINSLNRLNCINDLRFENNNASLGEDCYGDLEFKRFSTAIACEDMVTSAIDANLDGRNGEYFNVSLKDEYGNPLINKDIKIGFNGRIYNRTTNSNGQASLQINLKYSMVYTFAICFLGNDDFYGSFTVSKITVKTQKPNLEVNNFKYKSSTKSKVIKAVLKSSRNNPIQGKTISFTVNIRFIQQKPIQKVLPVLM